MESQITKIRRMLSAGEGNPNHDPKNGQFTCKDCGEEHSSEKELADHRTQKHTDTPEKSKADLAVKKAEQHKDNVDDFNLDADKLKEKGDVGKKKHTSKSDDGKRIFGNPFVKTMDVEFGGKPLTFKEDQTIEDFLKENKIPLTETPKIRKDLGDGFISETQGFHPIKAVSDALEKIRKEKYEFRELPHDRDLTDEEKIREKTLGEMESRLEFAPTDKERDRDNKIRDTFDSLSKTEKEDMIKSFGFKQSAEDDLLKNVKEFDDLSGSERGMVDRRLNKSKTGKMQTGSLVDSYKSGSGDIYDSYFLINAKENLKLWGVTPESIPRHIGSFKGMPFVITAKRFFEKSPYGDMTDHPDTSHFPMLGIKVGIHRPKEANEMMQQAAFQEEFRVGNIEDIFNKGDDYFALIKRDKKFANFQMPLLVSPAIFQLNPHEPANKITTWIGMHLAGLDEKPAYGNAAIYRGSCMGTKGECLRQLSAKLDGNMLLLPCTKKHLQMANLKIASIRIAMLRDGMQMSTDHPEIQVKNIYDDEEEELHEI
jgi:hypothetical protein